MGELTDKGDVGCEAGVTVSGNVYDDETAEMVDTDGEPWEMDIYQNKDTVYWLVTDHRFPNAKPTASTTIKKKSKYTFLYDQ